MGAKNCPVGRNGLNLSLSLLSFCLILTVCRPVVDPDEPRLPPADPRRLLPELGGDAVDKLCLPPAQQLRLRRPERLSPAPAAWGGGVGLLLLAVLAPRGRQEVAGHGVEARVHLVLLLQAGHSLGVANIKFKKTSIYRVRQQKPDDQNILPVRQH